MALNKIRTLPLTEDRRNAWRNKVSSTINASGIVAGNGIGVEQGPDGVILSLDVINDTLPFRYAGDFDTNQQYFPNQIVRVSPNKTYSQPYGAPLSGSIPFGSTAISGSSVTPISIGLFICVNYVPPASCNEAWLASSVSGLYSDGLPFTVVQSARYYAANVYYPVYPEIPSAYTSSYTIFNGRNNIVANQTFWQALPMGAMTMINCNGLTEYVMAFQSGSVFQTGYLPFNPH